MRKEIKDLLVDMGVFDSLIGGRATVENTSDMITGCKQSPVTASEREKRIAEFRTQGRKGCHLPGRRVNMMFTATNFDALKVMASIRGTNLTRICNEVVSYYIEQHLDIKAILEAMAQARGK